MKLWVLTDNRPGAANQAIALAKILNFDFEIKKLDYNIWASIPNLLKLGFTGLKASSKKDLKIGIPDVVISAGRRSASVAKALKKNHPKCKIIQILKPDISLKYFDALILPEHDTININEQSEKIIRIHGALTFYPEDQQKIDSKYWEGKFKEFNLKKPRIAILIGGAAKGCIFDLNHAKKLFEETRGIAEQLGASLLISTSRRTPPKVEAFLQDKFGKSSISHYFYHPKSEAENPYCGYLTASDYIIVTGDSISMISEALETGKPVYLFYSDSMLSAKHRKFIRELLKKEYAHRLEDFTHEKLKSLYPKHYVKDRILNIINSD